MPAISSALVVGGGVGGLTAATALRRQGIEVDLVEVNPDHSVYGVGIIQPNNTLRALDRIGLADECVARGGAFPGWRIFDADGRHLMDAPNQSIASPRHPPVNGITRPILQRILLNAAQDSGASIRTGVTITSMKDVGPAVEVGLSDGRYGRYDFLIGSDGLYSDVRRRLFGPEPAPSFSGQSVWRYNFRRPPEIEWGHVYYGATTKVGLVPMAPELMYMFLVTHEPGNPRMPADQLAALMRDRLDGYTGLVAELREEITDSSAVVYKPMEHLLLPAPWYRGRAIVIGDGAHATTPHLAQGAAMAIEDAVLLAELFGQDRALADLLDEFMARRFDRAKFVIDSSQRIAGWEMEQWAGVQNPEANPGRLLGEATHALMADY
jgi:2-polyprenyl-6-methoxyphenol hydroxylase-like FAD-dependent oxidoreductase